MFFYAGNVNSYISVDLPETLVAACALLSKQDQKVLEKLIEAIVNRVVIESPDLDSAANAMEVGVKYDHTKIHGARGEAAKKRWAEESLM